MSICQFKPYESYFLSKLKDKSWYSVKNANLNLDNIIPLKQAIKSFNRNLFTRQIRLSDFVCNNPESKCAYLYLVGFYRSFVIENAFKKLFVDNFSEVLAKKDTRNLKIVSFGNAAFCDLVGMLAMVAKTGISGIEVSCLDVDSAFSWQDCFDGVLEKARKSMKLPVKKQFAAENAFHNPLSDGTVNSVKEADLTTCVNFGSSVGLHILDNVKKLLKNIKPGGIILFLDFQCQKGTYELFYESIIKFALSESLVMEYDSISETFVKIPSKRFKKLESKLNAYEFHFGCKPMQKSNVRSCIFRRRQQLTAVVRPLEVENSVVSPLTSTAIESDGNFSMANDSRSGIERSNSQSLPSRRALSDDFEPTRGTLDEAQLISTSLPSSVIDELSSTHLQSSNNFARVFDDISRENTYPFNSRNNAQLSSVNTATESQSSSSSERTQSSESSSDTSVFDDSESNSSHRRIPSSSISSGRRSHFDSSTSESGSPFRYSFGDSSDFSYDTSPSSSSSRDNLNNYDSSSSSSDNPFDLDQQTGVRGIGSSSYETEDSSEDSDSEMARTRGNTFNTREQGSFHNESDSSSESSQESSSTSENVQYHESSSSESSQSQESSESARSQEAVYSNAESVESQSSESYSSESDDSD